MKKETVKAELKKPHKKAIKGNSDDIDKVPLKDIRPNQALTIEELKNKAVEYYRGVPVKRYTAMYIGRSEDTLREWELNDPDFSVRLQGARSEWVDEHVKKSPSPFVLERLEKEVFAERKEVTGAGGKDLSGLSNEQLIAIISGTVGRESQSGLGAGEA